MSQIRVNVPKIQQEKLQIMVNLSGAIYELARELNKHTNCAGITIQDCHINTTGTAIKVDMKDDVDDEVIEYCEEVTE